MKITCINGSARTNGSCGFVIDTVAKSFSSNNYEIAKYNVCNENIEYCRGCKSCYSNGCCVIHDDVEKIVTDILNSDYVIIAAPSYWAYVPAQLKVFIDRNTPYGDTNPNRTLFAKKQIKGIAIAIRAGKSEDENALILDAIEHYYRHLGINTTKRFSFCETDSLDDLLNKHSLQIQELCKYVESIK